jgi:hypothetical protein
MRCPPRPARRSGCTILRVWRNGYCCRCHFICCPSLRPHWPLARRDRGVWRPRPRTAITRQPPVPNRRTSSSCTSAATGADNVLDSPGEIAANGGFCRRPRSRSYRRHTVRVDRIGMVVALAGGGALLTILMVALAVWRRARRSRNRQVDRAPGRGRSRRNNSTLPKHRQDRRSELLEWPRHLDVNGDPGNSPERRQRHGE